MKKSTAIQLWVEINAKITKAVVNHERALKAQVVLFSESLLYNNEYYNVYIYRTLKYKLKYA